MDNYELVFISNFFNHHQRYLCDEFNKETGRSFLFIETLIMSVERRNMGWTVEKYPDYVIRYSEFVKEKERIQRIIDTANYVIIGSAPDELVDNRKKSHKLVFRYSERFYKQGCPSWQIPLRYIKNHLRYHKNEYMLCASAYTAADAAITGNFLNKTFKWGYFTEVKKYDLTELFEKKANNPVPTILWVSRFINLKHPETAIELANRLKNRGYTFKLQMIGNGPLENKIRSMIEALELDEFVELLGTMKPDEVRTHMEKANIFLFSSDFNEGWGAVLNESMNSGCSVVASHAIGSVPFLLEHGKNGMIYRNGDSDNLYGIVTSLINDKTSQQRLGTAAYETMCNLWNPSVAAKRFLILASSIANSNNSPFSDGPCSNAEVLENDWINW